MMAPFPAAARHRWFRKALAHLERYRRGGCYELPRTYLPEKKLGYWPWNHFGLEENRRSRRAIELAPSGS